MKLNRFQLLCALSLFLFETVNAISFKQPPLNEVIERSEMIVRGRVIAIEETDPDLAQTLNSIPYSEDWKWDDPLCTNCLQCARIVIVKQFKGRIDSDTILIPFYVNPYLMLLGFTQGIEYMLFLNSSPEQKVYLKTIPRFAVKYSNLEEYEDFIEEYLRLQTPEAKRKWIIKLCIHPKLSFDGVNNFKGSKIESLSSKEQELLKHGLNSMNFESDYYAPLLELVQQFGENDQLLEKCWHRLSFITIDECAEGLDLMLAIEKLNPNRKQEEIIQLFTKGGIHSEFYKYELIGSFVRLQP